MKTKVYIAAQFGRQSEMRTFAFILENVLGYNVVSRWLHVEDTGDRSVDLMRQEAEHDLEDVKSADLFILVNPPPYLGDKKSLARGGRMYEAGVADTYGVKRLVVIGDVDAGAVFLLQEKWEHYKTCEDFLNNEHRQKRNKGQDQLPRNAKVGV